MEIGGALILFKLERLCRVMKRFLYTYVLSLVIPFCFRFTLFHIYITILRHIRNRTIFNSLDAQDLVKLEHGRNFQHLQKKVLLILTTPKRSACSQTFKQKGHDEAVMETHERKK